MPSVPDYPKEVSREIRRRTTGPEQLRLRNLAWRTAQAQNFRVETATNHCDLGVGSLIIRRKYLLRWQCFVPKRRISRLSRHCKPGSLMWDNCLFCPRLSRLGLFPWTRRAQVRE